MEKIFYLKNLETDELSLLQNYVENNHSEKHNQYKLKIDHVFRVKRNGEEEKFKKLHNRKMLFHGTRTTNMAGILSKGLKIAPAEAPASGYMFGKVIL